jgi:tetratricopeptide (TPR) repeat protein
MLSAGALATGAYWIVHGSLDWLWPYPVIAAPVLALLGSAAAPSLRTIRRRSTRSWRLWPIAGLTVLALSAVTPFLADSYVTAVVENDWRGDPQRAISDLDRAHDLNRLDDFPLLLKGRIQAETGDTEGALDSYREALELRPEEFATHYLIAELEAVQNRSLARNEIRVALELNPLDRKVRQLAVQLGIPESQLAPLPEAEQG